MGGNIAGIYGAQIFRSDDRPLYRRGFTINIVIIVTGIAMAALRYIADVAGRRRIARQIGPESASDHQSQDEDVKTGRQDDTQHQGVLNNGHRKDDLTSTVA